MPQDPAAALAAEPAGAHLLRAHAHHRCLHPYLPMTTLRCLTSM